MFCFSWLWVVFGFPIHKSGKRFKRAEWPNKALNRKTRPLAFVNI